MCCVSCSVGSAENWRPDYNLFKSADLGSSMAGWAGEKWVNTNNANVRAIMKNVSYEHCDRGRWWLLMPIKV